MLIFDWLKCFFKASAPSKLFVSIKSLRLSHETAKIKLQVAI